MHLQFFFATFLLQKKANKGWVIVSTFRPNRSSIFALQTPVVYTVGL